MRLYPESAKTAYETFHSVGVEQFRPLYRSSPDYCVEMVSTRIPFGHPGQLTHTQMVTSTSRISASLLSSAAASRYSLIACWMFASASCSVAPWDQQPGRPGQETLNPSSDWRKAAL